MTVAWLTWRQLFANRRLYLALAFALIPVAVTLLFKWLVPEASGNAPTTFFTTIEKQVVVGTLLPLSALVFGTTAFGGEIDDGTLVYLLVKPVPRWRVVLSKYAVAVLCTTLVVTVALFAPWFLMRSAAVPFAAPMAYFQGAMVGVVLYTALFVMLGIMTRRSLVIGLFYVIAFEAVLSRSAPGVQALSIREFANAVAQQVADPALNFGIPLIAMSTVRNVGVVILVGGLALAMRKLRRYQMAERV